MVAATFTEARARRNPDYDWLTQAEGLALSNLRDALATLDRVAEKSLKGPAASVA